MSPDEIAKKIVDGLDRARRSGRVVHEHELIAAGVADAIAGVEAKKTIIKIWTCNDHLGHHPVGTATVVIAETEADARAMLIDELKQRGLYNNTNDEPFTLVEMPLQVGLRMLCDGDY